MGTPLELDDDRLKDHAEWLKKHDVTIVKIDSAERHEAEDVYVSGDAILRAPCNIKRYQFWLCLAHKALFNFQFMIIISLTKIRPIKYGNKSSRPFHDQKAHNKPCNNVIKGEGLILLIISENIFRPSAFLCGRFVARTWLRQASAPEVPGVRPALRLPHPHAQEQHEHPHNQWDN